MQVIMINHNFITLLRTDVHQTVGEGAWLKERHLNSPRNTLDPRMFGVALASELLCLFPVYRYISTDRSRDRRCNPTDSR